MLYKVYRKNCRVVIPENTFFKLLFHYISVSNIEIFEIITVSLGIAVHIVSAEKFVCALAGIAKLCVLSCCKAAKCKHYRRSVSQRLFHIVHYIRNYSKEVLGLNFGNGMLNAQKFRGLCSNSRFVKALLIITARISTLCIAHCENIRGVYSA